MQCEAGAEMFQKLGYYVTIAAFCALEAVTEAPSR